MSYLSPRFVRRARPRRLLAAAAALLLAACSTDDVTAPPRELQGTFTVDARTNWVYVSLADSAVVDSATAVATGKWDVAFQATNVALGAGTAGFCLCQNTAQAPTSAAWLAMTPQGEAADFDAVTAVPAGATFSADVFTATPYYKYNLAGDHRISPTFDVYLLERGTTVYKIQITSYYDATNTGRIISFRYARIAE